MLDAFLGLCRRLLSGLGNLHVMSMLLVCFCGCGSCFACSMSARVRALISCRPVTGCGCCWDEACAGASVIRSW